MSDGWGNPIVGGTTLRIPAIQSVNFVTQVSGWQINADGDAEFNQVQARGQVFVAGSGGSEIAIILSGGVPIIQLIPASVTQMTSKPEIFANADNAGLVNESMILNLLSGKSNSESDAGIQLFSEAADASSPATIVFEFGGVVAATLNAAGFTVDTWHPITLDAGWTAGSPAPQYRKDIVSGNIQFTGNASHAGFTVGTTINSSNPLPSAVRPASSHYYRSNDNFRAGVQYLSSGVLEAFPAAAGNTQVDLDGIVALL